ncbi:MAG: hypothetical protein ISR48_01265 [Alphaproteobacteria bacterium]|nr:hypothetical protein [Alphaproteobacteria bacterium]
MAQKPISNETEMARRDDADALDAVIDKIKADNPGWENSLPQRQQDAMARRDQRRRP